MQKLPVPIWNAWSMPGLRPEEREQAVGRLCVDQLVWQTFNCHVHSIQRIRQRCNATNSINDRACSIRRDRHILRLRKHMNNKFTWVIQTSRQTIVNNQKPISSDTVILWLLANNSWCLLLTRGTLILHFQRWLRNNGLAKAWWMLFWCMHPSKRCMGGPRTMVWNRSTLQTSPRLFRPGF
jgi:hypothetical protein